MKEKISMPLDTALNLIRDGKGNIDLNVPIDGNVNSPDFSVNSIMNKIMFKAIKAATVYYLKQSMQPYGALISIGSYLGKKATAVRLDPVKFAKGEVLLNEEHTAYLDKIAGLMKSKEGINVKLCGVGVPNELIVEAQPPQPPLENEVLLARMEQRAAAVKKHMVETGQVEANRLLACQAIVEAESEDVLSYIHLEI
jgi:hypothetical protein